MSQYATVTDIANLGIAAAAIASFTTAQKDEALQAASSEADSYLSSRYELPLATWPKVLRLHVANMAAYMLLSNRGFAPDGSDQNIRDRHRDAVAWLQRVAERKATLDVASTSPAVAAVPTASSSDKRGW